VGQLQPFLGVLLPGLGGLPAHPKLELGTKPPEQPAPAGDEAPGSRSAHWSLPRGAAQRV